MHNWLASLARWLLPDYDTLSEPNRRYTRMTAAILAYAVPLATAGLVWLVLSTGWEVLARHAVIFTLLLALVILFRRFALFLTVEISPGFYSTTSTTFENIVTWSAVFVFGPPALWLDVISALIAALLEGRAEPEPNARLQQARNLALNLCSSTVPWLVAFSLYGQWGGVIPLPGFSLMVLRPALLAVAIQTGLMLLIQLPLLAGFAAVTARQSGQGQSIRLLFGSWLLWYGLSLAVAVAAVFVAGLYTTSGPGIYLFFVGNALVASFVASRLGQSSEMSRQRSRELEQLERLGRELLTAQVDGSTLPGLLSEHLPGMFSYSFVEVCLFEDEERYRVLARDPGDPAEWEGVNPAVWDWFHDAPAAASFPAGHVPPWDAERLERHILLLPIDHPERGEAVGGLFIARRRSRGPTDELLPAAQTLAAQIASALHRAEQHEESLAHARTMRELQIAGEIQASFLPDKDPELEGWEISGTLRSARETSGDFFDLIPMWDGRLGLVIADVADKGVGAALYMALTRTLLHTYAVEYSTRYPDTYAFHPERVFDTVNQCILTDTRSDMFVTVFFGIIDPHLASLTYANAGHVPPLLCARRPGSSRPAMRALVNTGIPLGIMPGHTWQRGSVQLAPGDVLLLYTDGLTEAENEHREFFGEARLYQTLLAHHNDPASAISQALIGQVGDFVQDAPLHDDVTLLVVRRAPLEKPDGQASA